jgi:hypothetical protein
MSPSPTAKDLITLIDGQEIDQAESNQSDFSLSRGAHVKP